MFWNDPNYGNIEEGPKEDSLAKAQIDIFLY